MEVITWDCQFGRNYIPRVCCEPWALLVNLRKENVLRSLGFAHCAGLQLHVNSIILEWLGLERTQRFKPTAQAGSPRAGNPGLCPQFLGLWVFNIPREGDSTPPLGSLFQFMVRLTVKFFLSFRWNFLHSSFFPLPLVLLYHLADPKGSTGVFFFSSRTLSIFYRLIEKKPKSLKSWNTVCVVSLEILYYNIDECISVYASSCTSQFWPSILHTKV